MSKPLRKIHSYVRRSRSFTPKQEQLFAQYWKKYGIDETVNFADLFKERAKNPTILEIGFGMGDSLIALSQQFPEYNYIGIDVHRAGVLRLMTLLEAQKIDAVKIVMNDAVAWLEQVVPDNSLTGVLLFFPDPWPKLRHHKRRIVQADFAKRIADKLIVGGQWHLATDDENYARHLLKTLQAEPTLDNLYETFSPISPYRFPSKFATRGVQSGRVIWDLQFKKRITR